MPLDGSSGDATAPASFSLRRIALPAFGPSLLFGIGEGAIFPVVPLLARDLGASMAMAAFLATLIGIGSLLCNLPASLVTVRWGERGAIVAAGLWSAAAMALCLVASGLAFVAVACFMVGMSQAVYNLARQSYLTEIVPIAYRARALSTLGGAMRIGMFIGPFLSAAAVHVFGILAAFGVGIVACLAAAVVGARMPALTPHASGPEAQARGHPSLWSTLSDHRRVFMTIGIGVLLVSAVRASRQVVIPLWADHLALAPAAAALIYGIAGGVEMLLFYPAGRVMDIRGRRWVAVPSMTVMGLALLLMPFTHDFVTLLLAATAIGFGNGLGSGLVMTLGADHSPRNGRAYFLGIWRLMSDIGATAGPAMLSLLIAGFSLATGVFGAGMVAVLAAGLLARWVPSGRHAVRR